MDRTLRAGVNAGYQAHHGVQRHNGAAAVAEEGQCQTDNGHNTDTHAGIDQHLEHQSGSCTEADQPAHIVLAAGTHPNAANHNGQQQDQHQSTADKAQLLTDGGENIVRMLGKQRALLGTGAFEKTLTGQEIEQVANSVLKKLTKTIGAEIRA